MIGVSFGWAYFKAFDNRQLYLQSQARNEQLYGRLDSTRTNSQALRETLDALLYGVLSASHDLDEIAVPVWYKIYDPAKDEFRMIFVNREYEREFLNGADRIHYIGQLDKMMHGDLWKIYSMNDHLAMEMASPIRVVEPYRKKDGSYGETLNLKWTVQQGSSLYCYGMVLDYLD